MRGSKCRCGYATISSRKACPRCRRIMEEAEWPDEGHVLSFTPLKAFPEGLKQPHNLALVGVDKGPKLVCWTTSELNEADRVTIAEANGRFFCRPFDLDFRTEGADSELD